MSIITARPHGETGWAVPAAASNSYGPAQLRRAYKIVKQATRNGAGKTVAIVDAYRDPRAASDLNTYRRHFRLRPCTTHSGCLRIVNQYGKSRLPKANADWATEESLDLDMVSAICPRCHILLVEARNASTASLGTAENTAIRMGARYVSNSWSGQEYYGQDLYNSDFNHPGHVIDFASGDYGYDPMYPTDLQYVTAVGGTTLRHASNSRGWSETVWGAQNSALSGGTAGGCSALEPKPSWQRQDAREPDGCLNRTENDVAAVANPQTGVLTYDTYRQPGLFEVGGTSAATPIITAIYALAGTPERATYPARYPYLHLRHLFDVTAGTNGKCERFRKYLCHGEPGFDGPTGLGTPDGTGAFTDHSAHRVTLIDPGTRDYPGSARISMTITGLDTVRGRSLRWSARGLPTGLHLSAVPHSTKSRITGKLSASPGTYHVTVTAKDGRVTGSTHFDIVIVRSLTAPVAPSPGPVSLLGSLCLDGGSGASGQAVRIENCSGKATQNWSYLAVGHPDDAGTLRLGGECVSVGRTGAPRKAWLSACAAGHHAQQWVYLGLGALWNPLTGGCLSAKLSAGSQAGTARCTFGGNQSWGLPAGPVVNGVGRLCLDNPGSTSVVVSSCDSSSGQSWTLEPTGQVTDGSGQCLAANGTFTQIPVRAEACGPDLFQQWEPGPSGQLMNIGAGLCLTDRNNGPANTTVVMNDCYGDAGQIWGLN